jgi:hypothetical protein
MNPEIMKGMYVSVLREALKLYFSAAQAGEGKDEKQLTFDTTSIKHNTMQIGQVLTTIDLLEKMGPNMQGMVEALKGLQNTAE